MRLGAASRASAAGDRGFPAFSAFPVEIPVLGRGKRIFGETQGKKPLRLVDSKVIGDGVNLLTYTPEG